MFDKITQDYLEDVLVRLAHHSSAIEGNTISLPETASIILNNTLPNNGNITRREFYEVDNHQQAFQYIIDSIEDNEKLSISIIKGIHERLTERLQHDKGQFKKEENYIKGAEFSTTSPREVPQLMYQLIENQNFRLKHATSEDDLLGAILEFHIQFEKIHPFSDGNGRTGRMAMNYSLLENNLPPLIIRKNDKNEYMQILATAQAKEFPADKDIERFISFSKLILKEEKKRLLSFFNKASVQISDIDETREKMSKRKVNDKHSCRNNPSQDRG